MERYFSLKDHVYNYISQQISQGKLLPEEKINEQIICEALGISRTPVREALIQLATEGYIENRPRHGFSVRHISAERAEKLYQIIGVLDALAAALALSFIDKKDIDLMQKLVREMDEAIVGGSSEEYYRKQLEFHDVYTKKCGNEELITQLDLMKRHFLRHGYSLQADAAVQEMLKETNREHQEIVELFRAGDNSALGKYLRDVHWDGTKAVYDSI